MHVVPCTISECPSSKAPLTIACGDVMRINRPRFDHLFFSEMKIPHTAEIQEPESACRRDSRVSSMKIHLSLAQGILVSILFLSCLLVVDAGPQFETWIKKLIAEKGVDKWATYKENSKLAYCDVFHFSVLIFQI
jgi:hypothetical protein